ncbi:MAG: oligoribonuclease [Proteobacteria bacterium]|nr:MAG: oligoribonuclease [Pseudomonadota bacterium]
MAENQEKMDPYNLIWIDLEMTGLDPQNDLIIEIATVVTDKHLSILAEGPTIAIYQTPTTLAAMGEWCQVQHGGSGLTERVKNSTWSEQQAEQATLAFLRRYVEAGKSPMCGNSICQDRRFLARYMPKLEAFFHYRNLDVSTLKELAKRWKPGLAEQFHKTASHLAMDDIHDSINELKFYRERLLAL